MFGRDKRQAAAEEQEHERAHERDEAETLMKQTLASLDKSLAVKREVREKTTRFVGSLRPLSKTR